jgi:hypothetical protein
MINTNKKYLKNIYYFERLYIYIYIYIYIVFELIWITE